MKSILAIALVILLAGCATTRQPQCPYESSCLAIYCSEGKTLNMYLPYDQDNWEKLHKEGKQWTSTFKCVPNEEEAP
jgi:hypothetical protein